MKLGKGEIFKSLFKKCVCGSSMLEVERYRYDEHDEGYNFVVWERGPDGDIMGWRERLRWCWNILKTGKPWADSIIASNDDAREIANFILENLPQEVQNEKTKE